MELISITFEEMILQMKQEALVKQKLEEAKNPLGDQDDHLLQLSRSTDSKLQDRDEDENGEDSQDELERVEIYEEQYLKKFNDFNKAYWDL